MKDSEALEVIGLLNGAFAASRLDGNSVKVYRQLLSDLPVEAARKATLRLIGSSKFMPTIAEIRRATSDIVLGPQRTGVEAYNELLAAVRRIGRDYGSGRAPKFKDPLVSRCVGIWGSWNDLCNSPDDDPGGRARFVDLYDSLATREREDIASGIPLPPPRGDGPDFWLERPNGPRPPQLTESQVAVMPKPPRAPVVWNNEHRRLTAEELEAEMRKRDANP